jgi:hypothetical protein
MREEFNPADYSFVVKRRANPPKPWRWKIYRSGKSLPVERLPGFFESVAAASKAHYGPVFRFAPMSALRH